MNSWILHKMRPGQVLEKGFLFGHQGAVLGSTLQIQYLHGVKDHFFTVITTGVFTVLKGYLTGFYFIFFAELPDYPYCTNIFNS